MQVFDRQRVLDGRLRIGGEGLAVSRVLVQMVVREHGVIAERVGPAVREQVGDDVGHPAHLVGQDVDDARLSAHGRQARTVIAHCIALPGNGVSAPATGSRQTAARTRRSSS